VARPSDKGEIEDDINVSQAVVLVGNSWDLLTEPGLAQI
jgi:hypothetical protein